MKKYLWFIIFTSVSSFAQISQVTSGSAIQSSKINEVISKVNSVEDQVNSLNVQQSWITPTLTNGWVAYEPGQVSHATLQYYKDKLGIVHLRGLVKGTNNSVIATLPVGYRPSKHSIFMGWTSNGAARIDVSVSGTINYSEGASPAVYMSLDGITFRAE